jgi:hypothetical protein
LHGIISAEKAATQRHQFGPLSDDQIHCDVAAVTRVAVVTEVLLPVRAVDNRRTSVVRVEADDLGQLVTDPHQNVKTFAHI